MRRGVTCAQEGILREILACARCFGSVALCTLCELRVLDLLAYRCCTVWT